MPGPRGRADHGRAARRSAFRLFRLGAFPGHLEGWGHRLLVVAVELPSINGPGHMVGTAGRIEIAHQLVLLTHGTEFQRSTEAEKKGVQNSKHKVCFQVRCESWSGTRGIV